MSEIKMVIPKAKWGDVKGRGISFCKEAFLKVVELPEDQRICYLVPVGRFDQGPDTYRIKRPLVVRRYSYLDNKVHERRRSNLADIQGNYLYENTKATLARLYDEGFRAVRIEYEN